MENMESITLYDENGNPEEYELIDIFDLNGTVYGAFAPLLDESNQNEAETEVVMLKVVELDGEEAFSEIDNENEELEAFNELLRRAEAEDEDEE